MDVSEALQRRRTVRAFLKRPVSRETLETILEAALRTPSWANTQPWEIYVAGGEVLERIRTTFVERTRAKVPGHADMEMPGGWPEECRARTKALTAGRARRRRHDPRRPGLPARLRGGQPPLLRRPVRGLPVHGPAPRALVGLRPGCYGPEHHAGGAGARGGFGRGHQPGRLPGRDPRRAEHPRATADRHRHRAGLRGRERPRGRLPQRAPVAGRRGEVLRACRRSSWAAERPRAEGRRA